MGFIIFLLILLFVLYLIFGVSSYEDKGHWHHSFADTNHDTSEYYKAVTSLIEEVEIPEISISSRDIREGGVFSFRREYLKVKKERLTFYLCACPYGTGFFFSWWLKEKVSDIDMFIKSIPVIGKTWYKKRQYKTFYHLDTQQMFLDAIHTCVLKAIDELVKAEGMRGLTELERKPKTNFLTVS